MLGRVPKLKIGRVLQRMYSRWSEKRFVVSSIEESSGDEAGIKSCTLLIEGFNAYGWEKQIWCS